jgi:3'-phosphoadenosine 5'-phosphosulfate sulfotransferase (PAPS reductase)/FAD synthetase
MVLYMLEHHLPLDEVMFYDTGMEFEAIYRIRDKLLPILAARGVRYTELSPPAPFLFDMLERPVESKQNGFHLGYGWCGGRCRWGTTRKQQTLDAYNEGAAAVYIGFAADEPHRIQGLSPPKCAPLAEWGLSESDCLAYCRERGFRWLQASPAAEGGYIDLYDILDRVSCWCCANKNRRELKNIYTYLPDYWARLKALQSKLERPMKRYTNKMYGAYGRVEQLEEVFKGEAEI